MLLGIRRLVLDDGGSNRWYGLGEELPSAAMDG